MNHQSPRQTMIEDIQDLLLDSPDVKDFLEDLAQFAARNLSQPGNKVFCGITLLRNHGAGTVASSGTKAQLLDELQYNFHEGPCLKAGKEQILVHIPDLSEDPSFPDYTEAALLNGIRSLLALPFELASDTTKACLNLYAEKRNAFGPTAVRLAEDFVAQASKGLRLSVLIGEHTQTAEHLRTALASRTAINLAVGVLIAQNSCTQKEAIDMLVKASSERNIKLRDLAAAIVHTAGGGAPKTHFT
ncbi:GAF and ANTAR domain-containing protein [Paenarthrobacter sp. S56]|uniref:GAF and ANTAR domain-containing protein n=1 Tax=Paenarthrobacter sp. S56 TaxID=3138179 RepID=UPI00321A6067